MTTQHRPLTLDDYRAQLVQQLRACSEPTLATELLVDIEAMFAATHTARLLQKSFWRDFSQDLDLLAQRAALLDPAAATTLQAVILAARAVTLRALRLLQHID